MRHRKAGFKLGRTASHRKAMLRNLSASVLQHGQVVTSVPKAKAVQPIVEKIITKAKRGDLHSRRQVISMLGGDRRAFDWLYLPKDASEEEKTRVGQMREDASAFFDVPESSEVERNRYGKLRKAPWLVRHVFENIAPRYADRQGGCTRIVKIGYRRLGDATPLCVLQFVGAEEGPEIGGKPSSRRRTADKRTAYAAKLRKGGTAKAEKPAASEPASDAGGDAE